MVLMDDDDGDGSWVIESLDSLWFFSHVFSSSSTATTTTQFLSFATDENTSSPEPVLEEPSKPISQILLQIQDHQTQEHTRCGELAAAAAAAVEIEPEMWKPMNMEEEMVESPEYQKEERRKKRSKRCKRSMMKQRRKILGELDLCFDGKEVWMPPFDDNMAMKEHLKSWAYAVACTVR